MKYRDGYTGKMIDKPKWADFGSPNGMICDECGTECIDRCINCGAPVCCPKCCHEASMELASSVS